MLAGCTNDHNCQILPLAPIEFSTHISKTVECVVMQLLPAFGSCSHFMPSKKIGKTGHCIHMPLGKIDVQNLLSSQPTYCLFPSLTTLLMNMDLASLSLLKACRHGQMAENFSQIYTSGAICGGKLNTYYEYA